jgi:peptidoglycan lytic transglycosylase
MAIGALCWTRSIVSIAVLGLVLAGCASGPGSSARGVGTYIVGSPYEENGIWYYPAVDYHYDRTGTASWYGADYDGKYTANGEIYHMNELTAAHPTLPLPSIVQVTDLQNGRSLQLRVNDRGPFVDGRMIDVSRRAAQLLGFETQGTAPVRVKILKEESIAAADEAMRNNGQIMTAAASAPPVTPPMAGSVSSAPVPPAALRPASLPAAAPGSGAEFAAAPISAAQMPRSLPNTTIGPGGPSGRLYIQAGAFSVRGNAQRVRSQIARLGSVVVTTTSVNGIEMYRVRLGPVENADEADRLLARVVDSGYRGARIVGD